MERFIGQDTCLRESTNFNFLGPGSILPQQLFFDFFFLLTLGKSKGLGVPRRGNKLKTQQLTIGKQKLKCGGIYQV